MATAKFSRFSRPEAGRPGQITDRDLDILDAVLRYRFCSAAQIVRLVGGNEDVTHRRLRRLWECGLVTRWAFPGFRTHSEFYYYLDSREPLDLLAERRQLETHPQMLEAIRSHREKDCAGAAIGGRHMQLGFLNHALMISRMHFMVEMACRKSGGVVALEAWCQGGQIAGHKADVPKVRSTRQADQPFWQEIDETEREDGAAVGRNGQPSAPDLRKGVKGAAVATLPVANCLASTTFPCRRQLFIPSRLNLHFSCGMGRRPKPG